MKVILTEEQLNEVMMLEKAKKFLEWLIPIEDDFDPKLFKQKVKAGIAIGLTTAVLVAAVNLIPGLSGKTKEKAIECIECVDNQDEKVNAVRDYMEYALEKNGYSVDKLELTPEKIVDYCNKYNYDIPLLLAQAHLESCFGMTPRARRTNSVFSVGSYDNGQDVCKYATQDDSVEGYIKLMNREYISNADSVDDMLEKGFINTKGHKYASDKSYESKVNSIRNKIIQMYPELAK